MAPNEPVSAKVSIPAPAGAFMECEGDRTVVWLHGEHDASTVGALSETIAKAIAADHADLVLDLSEIRFMSAATVGVIALASEFLRLRQRDLVLRAPSRSARRVIDLCDLTELLDSASTGPTRVPGGADALGTFVEVPTTAPAARPDPEPAAPAADPALVRDSVRVRSERP